MRRYIIMEKRRKETIYSVIAFFVVLAIFVVIGTIKKRSLYKNAEVTNAIVIDHFFRVRYEDYYSYKYVVDNKEYQGSGHYNSVFPTVSVGDTVVVIYNQKNPKQSQPKREIRRFEYLLLH